MAIPIPIPRLAYLKTHWISIYTPLVDLNFDVMMNLKNPSIDLRIMKSKSTKLSLEKAKKFIQTVLKGVKPKDASLLLDSNNDVINFSLKEIKSLSVNSQSRAIGRVVGKDGKIKKQIETTSNTKIYIKGGNVCIIGDNEGLRISKEAVCRLVMGANPGGVERNLKKISAKNKNVFFENKYLEK